MNDRKPKISVVTVGMNHLRYLKDLLPSIYRSVNTPPPPTAYLSDIEVIYVDNCSTDGSVAFVEAAYPQVKIIRNQEALGFGENNNKGVLAAHGDYIAIINPDIVVQGDALEKLLDYAMAHPEAGIIVPQLLNPDGTLQRSVRRYVDLKTLVARGWTRGADKAENATVGHYLCRDVNLDETQPIDWAIGAALFMKRELYAELGGFDTDYFLYMEDEDICLRSWKLKRPVMYCPEAKMIHNHLRASAKFGRRMFIHLKSMVTFFRKHGLSPTRD